MPREEDRIAYLDEIELEFSSGKRLARISDISSGGCYVDSIVNVPVGEPAAFGFTRPGTSHVRFTGTVAYILDGFGFGIQFKDLSAEARQLLETIISERRS